MPENQQPPGCAALQPARATLRQLINALTALTGLWIPVAERVKPGPCGHQPTCLKTSLAVPLSLSKSSRRLPGGLSNPFPRWESWWVGEPRAGSRSLAVPCGGAACGSSWSEPGMSHQRVTSPSGQELPAVPVVCRGVCPRTRLLGSSFSQICCYLA